MSFNKQETNYFIPSSLTLSDKAIFRISYPSGSRIKFKILNKKGKEAYSKSDKLILRSLNFKDHRLTEISIDNWK